MIRALRRVPELVADHRRAAAAPRLVAHLGGLPRVEGERLLAQHVLADAKRGNRELAVRGGRRRDRDRVEIVAHDELVRLGVHAGNARGSGRPLGLVAMAAADRADLPALRQERGDVHLRAEADADDPDVALRRRHRGASVGPRYRRPGATGFGDGTGGLPRLPPMAAMLPMSASPTRLVQPV